MVKTSGFKRVLPLAVLILIIVALSIIAVLLTRDASDTENGISAEESFSIADFAVSDITRLEYICGDVKVSLLKNGNVWFTENFAEHEADGKLVDKMLASLTGVTAVRLIEGGELSEYGLDDPMLSVKVSLKDGSEHRLDVGVKGSYKGYSYLSFDGKIYMFSDTLSSHFNVKFKDILGLEDNFPSVISKGTVMSLTLTDKNGNTVTYSNCEKMAEFIATMKLTFKFHDLVAVDASEGLMSYGIGESSARIDVFYNAPSDTQPNLLVDANYTLRLGEGSSDEAYYVMGDSSDVYTTDSDSVNQLIENILSHSEAHKTECASDAEV